MRVAIAAPTIDPDGYVMLDVDADSLLGGERRRRVNRVATLDGGAVLNDFGYSHADRTLDLAWTRTDDAVEASVLRMTELYSTVVVAMPDGVYSAGLEFYEPARDQSRVRLLVLSRLSQ